MGIRIDYTPVGSTIGAAYATGVGRAKERQADKATAILQQNEQRQFQYLLAGQQNMWANERLGKMHEFQAEQRRGDQTFQEGMMRDRFDFEAEQNLLASEDRFALEEQRFIEGGLLDGSLKYTEADDEARAKLDHTEGLVMRDPKLNDKQRAQALRDVRRQRGMIKPHRVPPHERRPSAEETIGRDMIERDGQYFTVDDKGVPQAVRGVTHPWEREQASRDMIMSTAAELMKLKKETATSSEPMFATFADAIAAAQAGYGGLTPASPAGGDAPAAGPGEPEMPAPAAPTEAAAPPAGGGAASGAGDVRVEVVDQETGRVVEVLNEGAAPAAEGTAVPPVVVPPAAEQPPAAQPPDAVESTEPTRLQAAVAQDPAFGRLNAEQQQRMTTYFDTFQPLAAAQETLAAIEAEEASPSWQARRRAIPLSMRGPHPQRAAAEAALTDAKKRKQEAYRRLPSEAQAELVRRETETWETEVEL